MPYQRWLHLFFFGFGVPSENLVEGTHRRKRKQLAGRLHPEAQVAKSEPSQDEGSKKGNHAPCGIDHVRLGESALFRRSVSFFTSFKCGKKTERFQLLVGGFKPN